MTEHELLAETMKLCGQLGLLYHHCPDGRGCQGPKGMPDLPLIVGHNGLLVVELKSADGERSPAQDLWAFTLARAIGSRAQLWRPENLERGDIRARLEELR